MEDLFIIQIKEKYRFSYLIQSLIEKGVIEFKKLINEKQEIFYDAIIKIDKEEFFFKILYEEIITFKTCDNKYGLKIEYFLKALKIIELIEEILKELNLNININFKDI